MNLLLHLQNTSFSLIIQCCFHWQRVIFKGLPSFLESHFAQVWCHGPENCHRCTSPSSNCHSPPYWQTKFLEKVFKNAFPVIHWLCRAGLQDKVLMTNWLTINSMVQDRKSISTLLIISDTSSCLGVSAGRVACFVSFHPCIN